MVGRRGRPPRGSRPARRQSTIAEICARRFLSGATAVACADHAQRGFLVAESALRRTDTPMAGAADEICAYIVTARSRLVKRRFARRESALPPGGRGRETLDRITEFSAPIGARDPTTAPARRWPENKRGPRGRARPRTTQNPPPKPAPPPPGVGRSPAQPLGGGRDPLV